MMESAGERERDQSRERRRKKVGRRRTLRHLGSHKKEERI